MGKWSGRAAATETSRSAQNLHGVFVSKVHTSDFNAYCIHAVGHRLMSTFVLSAKWTVQIFAHRIKGTVAARITS